MKPLKQAALAGGYWGQGVAYDASNLWDQRTAGWMPPLWSADTELNGFRDRIVSRARDLVRNDGWASGGVTKILDNVVGATFRPVPKPDYRALYHATGNKAFDATWANEFGKALSSNYRTWATDPSRYCDVSRMMTISQMMRLAFRHKLIDGDALALMLWLPDRVQSGAARYATTVQLVDPDRLSNPNQLYDMRFVRGGVQIDEHGAPVGYHIRRAHLGDWYNGGDAVKWDYIERETPWGRPLVVHDFDHDRAGQHRGGAGILTPVIQRLKMLIQYDGTELDSAIINSIFGAYISSPFDHELIGGALTGDGDKAGLNDYQASRTEFHKDRNLKLNGARIPILFPGEDIKIATSARPNEAFPDFEAAMLCNVASAFGISYEQLSQNWSKTNYSSARAALLEAWKSLGRRRTDFAVGFANPIFGCFTEESMDVDDLPMPADAPGYEEMRAAYSRCHWLGPGRGWIDPVKEREGAVLGMEAGLSTLEQEAADAGGHDWEEILDQRVIEVEGFKNRGLTLPEWGVPVDEAMATEKIGG